jgi:hypothetical protein
VLKPEKMHTVKIVFKTILDKKDSWRYIKTVQEDKYSWREGDTKLEKGEYKISCEFKNTTKKDAVKNVWAGTVLSNSVDVIIK